MGGEILVERRFTIRGLENGEELRDKIDQHEREYRRFAARRKRD
jgi:hypothetical protein